jgi:putative ABC transport system ATP-binding protein
MTGDLLLEARAIVKELGQGAGKVRALKGVDLGLRGGELTLLMGPSGSGKTTLLSILGCILSPTEGEVVICGSSTKGLKPEGLARLRRNHVGFIFQDYNLFPTLTALENIRLALDVRGVQKLKQRTAAEEALVAVGLADKIGSYPSQMSGGQQQRVAIARALAGQPSVILADEPTAALDSENGQAIMALLAEIARDSTRAVLTVTHDPRTLGFADRIVHIEDGLIVREERPRAKGAHVPRPEPDESEPETGEVEGHDPRPVSDNVPAERTHHGAPDHANGNALAADSSSPSDDDCADKCHQPAAPAAADLRPQSSVTPAPNMHPARRPPQRHAKGERYS